MPLDGRGSLRTAAKALPKRPERNTGALLEPAEIAVVGVSSKPESFGRIILSNIQRAGFDPLQITVVKKNEGAMGGVKCVPSISDLPGVADLLVITAPAKAIPGIIDEANTSGKVRSGIIISGGAGETEGSEVLGDTIREAIKRGRGREDGGAVFLGPNCMGVQSMPGRYDTFFIPADKLPTRSAKTHPVAIISQSGAFIVSRLSAMSQLSPSFTVSIGNQCNLTVSDLLWALADREDVQVAAVYLEGFVDLDGIETLRAVRRWTECGKTVVFYKAGRTESGRAAAAGHTTAVAGDYDICQTAMRHAGAMVARDFREFSELVEVAALLWDRELKGNRLFAVTNAGMEAVGMADALAPEESGLTIQPLSEPFEVALRAQLEAHGLSGLVTPRNPLDLTPMAGEDAYDAAVRVALVREEVDALIVSCVPLAPQLRTLEHDLGEAGAFPTLVREWLAANKRPIVFVVDAGPEFEPLAWAIRAQGIPVFRSADEAARRFSAWAARRLRHARTVVTASAEESGKPQPVAP